MPSSFVWTIHHSEHDHWWLVQFRVLCMYCTVSAESIPAASASQKRKRKRHSAVRPRRQRKKSHQTKASQPDAAAGNNSVIIWGWQKFTGYSFSWEAHLSATYAVWDHTVRPTCQLTQMNLTPPRQLGTQYTSFFKNNFGLWENCRNDNLYLVRIFSSKNAKFGAKSSHFGKKWGDQVITYIHIFV